MSGPARQQPLPFEDHRVWDQLPPPVRERVVELVAELLVAFPLCPAPGLEEVSSHDGPVQADP
ncbi:hypothetical protein U7230_07415 [Carboxydochorda subterranea]|uniref:Uncharacterized protein n=1 Tax=Carboxydichorda subterranea TaxID=3109565 RepID=A0ABZ1C1Y8_9FIRM|nr:hypothetical protein [Limnochorda sp. L945t]WRP18811.1 hypothetical protein U7230_07415 [Limnochorda sp. L945t]